MPFNPDGSWTSPKSGKTYPPDVPRSELDPDDDAALSEELQGKLVDNPVGDTQVQGNTVTGARIGLNAPGAQVDTSQADFEREGMAGLMAQLQQQAATGEGSWENALKAATQRSQATASALGQSDPDLDYGSAAMLTGNAQAGARQRAVGQGNILREQSKMDAQDQLGSLTAVMGAGDLDQAAAEARARQGVRAANLQLKQDATKRNMDFVSGVGGAATGIATMGAAKMSDGGTVPGQPKVFGDDSANDVVPAKLTPKEVVLPLSVTLSEDPAAAAYQFMKSLAAKGEAPTAGGAQHLAEGGEAGWKPTGQYTDAWAPGKEDPTGPKPGSFDMFGVHGDVQAPSVENGAILDTRNFEKTRNARAGLQAQLAQRARGGGPSVAPQMTTNANDAAIAQAMAARMGGNPNAISGGAAVAQSGAGDAAAQKANEQSAGSRSAGQVGAQARSQEMTLAQAQQQAAWGNTQTNLGISLANQAAMRQLFSGAGQAAAAGASLGSKSPSFGGYSSEGIQADAEGNRGGPADLSASDPEFKAHGGPVGMADGGTITARGPSGERLDSATDKATMAKAKRAAQDADVYEEETGMRPVQRGKEPGKEKTIAQRLAEFARQHLTTSTIGMAEGGAVPASYQPAPIQPWLFGHVPTNAVAPGQLPPELAAIATQPALPQERYAPPAGPVSSAPVMTPAEQSISRDMGAPPTVAHQNAQASFDQRAARERLGIKPGAGPTSTGAPPVAPPEPAVRPMVGGVRAPPSHAMQEGFVTNEAQLANQMAGEAAQQEARDEAASLVEQRKVMEAAARDEATTRERVRLNTQSALDRWRAATDEASKVDSNIDPGRFWAERTTGQKILGIIGLALGAAGTGPDGINKAAVMMNQAIDRDVDAQKARFEAAMKKGAAKTAAAQTYYGMAREAGMDELAATHAAKAASLEAAALKARTLGAATKEQKAKAAMMAFDAALTGAAIDKTKESERWTANFQQKNVENAIHAAAAANKGGLPAGEQGKVFDITSAAGNIRRNIAKAKEIIKRSGTVEWTGTEQTELESALGEAAQDWARMRDPGGTVKEGELANAVKQIGVKGGEYGTRNATALKLLEDFEKGIDAREDLGFQVRGLAPPRRTKRAGGQ